MKITNLCFFYISVLAVVCAGEPVFLYSNTRICSRHRASLCLALDAENDVLVLDKRRRLRFDIETVQRINMHINRIYTYITDKATRKKVKSCLIKKSGETQFPQRLTLAPCDTSDQELVLAAMESLVKPVKPNHLSHDEFVLRELSYLEEEPQTTGPPLCLTLTCQRHSVIQAVSSRKDLRAGTLVSLEKCASESESANEYGQEFKATHFNKQLSSRSFNEEESGEDSPTGRIGMFCSTVKHELCIGISLTNGTVLDNNKFIQVKNLTKNSRKELEELKMEWYLDLENNRLASAAEMDYCMEAIYGAPIGRNRKGREQFDNILHLGSCDPNRIVASDTPDAFRGLPASESFLLKEVNNAASSYLEIRATVPDAAKNPSVGEGVAEDMCVSIVRCVRHDFGHCTRYNSVTVTEAKDLEQGAHVRLKPCDSANLISQRFHFIPEVDQTPPPTRFPTPKPPQQTASPTVPKATSFPSATPTTTPVASPTPSPVVDNEHFPPTKSDDDEASGGDVGVVSGNGRIGLKAGLAFVGVLCLVIIVVGVAYYYKHKGDFQQLPEEDENFIARV